MPSSADWPEIPEDDALVHDLSTRPAPGANRMIGAANELWRHLPVQIKFFTIAITLIILSISGAFLFLQRDYYQAEQAALAETQKKVTFSHALLLAEPLRDGDVTTAKRLMTTIIAAPDFVGAAIHDSGRRVVAVGKDVASGDPKRLHMEPIIYSDERGIYEIGQLITLTSDAPIREAVWEQFERHLITMAILVLSLGGAVIVAHHFAIGMPLSMIVQAIDGTREDDRPMRIPWRSPDEIGRLAEAFDNYVQSEWSYKRDLVAANTLLEERVAIRTRELSEALEDANGARDAAAKVALEDGLTGLLNRRAFIDRLCQALAKHRRRDDALAVMFIDLDRFKNVNDSFGHGVGDNLLCAMADRLRLLIGQEGTVARLGGDEFAVFFKRVTAIDDVTKTARLIVADLNRPLTVDGKAIHPGASMGIAIHPKDGDTHDALMANADMALYHAKDGGRGQFCFFDADMRANVDREDQVATELRQAVEKKELQVAYQPKVDLESGQLIGFEALLRWRHETLGQVHPDEFLSVAEDRGLILNIGCTVVDQVTRDVAEWLASGFDPGTIAINIHPVELRRRNHMDGLLGQIEERGLAFERFILEVTENCVIGRGNEEAIAVLSDLSERGLALSLDDFGTGYASLKHLRELPLDEIKIDRGFTAGMIRDPATTAIVSATVDLSKNLQIRVVAEGIETQEQVDHLKGLGRVAGQGYLLGRPMNATKVKSWLQQSRQLAVLDRVIDVDIPALIVP